MARNHRHINIQFTRKHKAVRALNTPLYDGVGGTGTRSVASISQTPDTPPTDDYTRTNRSVATYAGIIARTSPIYTPGSFHLEKCTT